MIPVFPPRHTSSSSLHYGNRIIVVETGVSRSRIPPPQYHHVRPNNIRVSSSFLLSSSSSSFHAAVPLLLLLLLLMMMMIVTLPPMVEAWTPAQSSSFIGDGRRAVWRPVCSSVLSSSVLSSSSLHSHSHHGAIWTMYQEEEGEEISSGTNPINAWTVLSTTERWICRTLDQTNHAAAAAASTTSRTNNNSKNSHNNNPYVRKEISYYCEAPPISETTTTTSTTTLVLFVASLFRHLKEIRHIGEQHIQYEMKLQQEPQDDDRSYTSSSPVTRTTLRQTHVIVVPFHTVLSESFVVFDTICQTIQQMRRHARDFYYHKHPTSSRPTNNEEEEEEDYSISINCAHLHPLYGPPPPPQGTTNTDNDDDEYNRDPKYREYQQQRLLARQSPYPTIVMEVRVTPMIPPLEFVSSPTLPMSRNHHQQDTTTTTNQNPISSSSTTAISWSDIQKLEALFGQSAYLKETNHHIETVVSSSSSSAASSSSEWTDHPSAEDSMDVERKEEDENYLWDHVVGNTLHEIVVPPPVPFIRTPIQQIQEWIGRPTPTTTPPQISSVTTTNTTHADEAYEYVFTNIAMLLENDDDDPSSTARYYLVFSHFLLHAATSFEQFTTEVQQLYSTIVQQVDATYDHQTSSSKLTMTTYHPEHIQSTHRSPFPLLVLERTENMIRS